jgi:hypothetical protein
LATTAKYVALIGLEGPGFLTIGRDLQSFRSPAVLPYTISVTRSGNYIVNLLFDNVTVLDNLAPVNVSFDCQPSIVHGPSCSTTGATVYEAGKSATFIVQSRDFFQNSRTVGGDLFLCQIISSTSTAMPCKVRDLNSGVYNFV